MTQIERLHEELAKRDISIKDIEGSVRKRLERNSDGRAFKALWSPEVAGDLRAYHGIDAEKELIDILLQMIDLELAVEAGMPFEEACDKFYGSMWKDETHV